MGKIVWIRRFCLILGTIGGIEFILWNLLRLSDDAGEPMVSYVTHMSVVFAVIALAILVIYWRSIRQLVKKPEIEPGIGMTFVYWGILLHALAYTWWGIGAWICTKYVYVNVQLAYLPQLAVIIGWILQHTGLKKFMPSGKEVTVRRRMVKLQGLAYFVAYLFVMSLSLSSMIFYIFSYIIENEADAEVLSMLHIAWLITFFGANIFCFAVVTREWKCMLVSCRKPQVSFISNL